MLSDDDEQRAKDRAKRRLSRMHVNKMINHNGLKANLLLGTLFTDALDDLKELFTKMTATHRATQEKN
jgi:hypothetical protein